MKQDVWIKGVVLRGQKLGRTFGFPTVNLDPLILSSVFKRGVYVCKVQYQNIQYQGALFFGPRLVLGEKTDVLEIYILDFNLEIYDEEIEFKMNKYLRPVLSFKNTEALKIQLAQDVKTVEKALTKVRERKLRGSCLDNGFKTFKIDHTDFTKTTFKKTKNFRDKI